jgi:hypothetical protein
MILKVNYLVGLPVGLIITDYLRIMSAVEMDCLLRFACPLIL